MGQVLSIQYRPKTFGELVGQKTVTQAIQRQYQSKREPSAWMFHGQSGGGKTTIARILAMALQCKHQDEFGYPCEECYKNYSQFEIHEINASEVSGVDQIKEVVMGSEYKPMQPTRRKVYILDEAQRLSSASQNMLLKFFEDAPRTTVWIICTTEPEKILHTLRNRCIQFSVVPLKRKDIELLVKEIASKEKVKEDVEPFIEAVLEAKITSPRIILYSFEKFLAGVDPSVAVQSTDSAVDTRSMAVAITKGDLETVHNVMIGVTLEDVRVIRVAVSKYLTAMLLKTLGPANHVTWGITKLAEASRVEESMQVQYTAAVLHQLCRKFGGGKAE